ncbi:MAG TPA: sugar phosphate isomerase/epimerase family protein [Micromonosporaceae bacterium]
MAEQAPQFSMMEYVAIDLPFADELAAFAAGGARGVGLSFFKPPRGRHGPMARLAEEVQGSGLQVTYVWPQVPSVLPIPGFAGPVDPAERVAAMIGSVESLAALRPLGIGCVTGPLAGYDTARARQLVVDGLREVAQATRAAGLRLAIEPIHSQEADVFSFVATIADMVALIEEIGEPGVGVIADFWHLYGQPNAAADLERHADQIFLVHLSDRRDPTRSTCDRALPGDGIADVVGMLRALAAGGYSGWYELEVLSDDGTFGHDFPDSLWRMHPRHLVELGRGKFLECHRRATE